LRKKNPLYQITLRGQEGVLRNEFRNSHVTGKFQKNNFGRATEAKALLEAFQE
jgi:hypothetical protein